MEPSPSLPIRSIGDEVAYSDNAEGTILEILSRVSDPSDGSDELAAQIDDWPTRYHCSPQRSNLLRPFKITPGMTVLEIGAGTGALTRYLAEQGAKVTAIEGTRARAQSVAMRCRGIESVEVICGDFKNFKPAHSFDLVLVVGVLEYAASAAGGRSTPESFLEHVVACLKPEGVVILAIENQLGLKYLLGGKEDHLGAAWVGIEGYPGDHGVRTWGRHTLGGMLRGCGLINQRWLFPFPDYKTPSSIVSEQIYDTPQCPILIDQWTAPPIVDHSDPERPFHDDRAAHGVFLSEGLGADVANSFLIAASRDPKVLEGLIAGNTLVWHFGGDRKRARRRVTTVTQTDQDSLLVRSHALSPSPAEPKVSWVTFHPDRNQPYIEGPNLEQEILEACRRGSSADVEAFLELWWNHLASLVETIKNPPAQNHPFLSQSTIATLGPDYLDVQPSNFIRVEGDLAFIDREWVALPAVDAAMVRLRALWYLARTLIISGAPLPWGEDATVESLTARWIGKLTTAPDSELFTQLYIAEATLQSEVSGGVLDDLQRALETHGRLSRKDVLAGQTLGQSESPEQSARDLVPALKAAMNDAGHYQQSLEKQLMEAGAYTLDLGGQIEDQKNRADQAEHQFQAAAVEAAQFQSSLEKQIEDQKNRADQAEHQFQAAADEARQFQSSLEKQIEDQKNRAVQAEHQFQAAAVEAAQFQSSLEKQIEDQKNRAVLAEHHIHAAQKTISNLEHQASEAAEHISNLEQNLGESAQHIKKIEESLGTVRKNVADLEATVRSKDFKIAGLDDEIETAEITISHLRIRLEEEETKRRKFESHPLIRIYRRLRWWLPQ